MAATIDPPAAPPAGVTIVDTGPPKPPPAPTTTIRVSEMPKSVEPPQPGKRTSATEKMFEKLRAKATGATPDPVSPPTQKPDPGTTPPGDPNAAGSAAPDPAVAGQKAGDPKAAEPQGTPPAAEDPKDGRTNPWKLVDRYKTRAAELEKQVAEAKTNALAEQQRKEYLDQIESLTKRRDELENEIRFVDYSKSAEFQTKYQKPYEEAWKAAASELSEIVYTDPQTRQSRPATVDDLSQLVQLPLAQAREVADAVFGKFADDVMAHRKEIRNLFNAQSAALKEAREKGAERAKQQAEMTGKQSQDIADFCAKTWAEANKAVTEDPAGKYFQPIEGDAEGNQRLSKGYALVDRAFSENPADPKMTPEQRREAIKRHAAVRHRAAAFGRIKAMYEKSQETIAALEKELDAFKKSVPPTGGGAASAAAAAAASGPKSTREDVFSKLRALAK